MTTEPREVTHPAYGVGEVIFVRDGWAYARFPNPPGRIDRRDGVIPYAWVKVESEPK